MALGHGGPEPALNPRSSRAAALPTFFPLKYSLLLHFFRCWHAKPKHKQGVLRVTLTTAAHEAHKRRGRPACRRPAPLTPRPVTSWPKPPQPSGDVPHPAGTGWPLELTGSRRGARSRVPSTLTTLHLQRSPCRGTARPRRGGSRCSSSTQPGGAGGPGGTHCRCLACSSQPPPGADRFLAPLSVQR